MPSTKLLSQENFLDRCKKLYNDSYQFDKTIYKNLRSNVILTCVAHGDFTKNARSILNGAGCPNCKTNWKKYVDRQRMTTKEFVQKAKHIHEGFYSYQETKYINSRTPVIITCPIHGNFKQGAGGHLEGYGCRECGNKKHGDYRPWYIKTYFDRFPEKINVPAKLYLLFNDDEEFYKVGITVKQEVSERIKYMAHYTFEIIDVVSDTMYNVAIAEQKILQDNQKYKPKKRFGGYTGCLKNFVDIRKYLPESGR